MKPLFVLVVLSTFSLAACDNGQADSNNQQAVDALIKKTKDELVRVEGGTFQMGDFGPIDPNLTGSDKGLPYSADQDNKPLHKVTLDTFYMLPTKVTYADYDVYTQATGKDKINSTNEFEMQFRQDNVPAGVDWYQAKDYCDWLAKETSLPFALPTEAQWEYAARSGGKFIPYGTSTGTLEKGKSIPTSDDVDKATQTGMRSNLAPYPVKLYPPNKIGLYQMGDNGYEWVSDWYQADYYQNSPEHNPQGPDEGDEKVVRGLPHGDGWGAGLTMQRYHAPSKIEKNDTSITYTARCVVNVDNIDR
ncbi:formylglycine-generating enzyme family protein [Chromohalobacter nigrandesensis]|uniref:formylglycine-generating enzyme family protein n=1 Tax=Chromohalobacter nigrandesensis TaxID=119863 RepID=UPI001FF1BC0C|nr:SUMF1/EgtB/PvdO family nonheme iron enzyme [Chromohalobacter nigrandesensis]MCK0746220.1 formylglycine-generating enzyme family protein [Chromohalobacter nigrandesensis]